MSQYGCTIPRRGRALIAKILAEKMPLKISRIMMGQGVCPEDVFPGDLEDLVEPVAAGTSTEPTYDGDTVHMMGEYRSDLNGGPDQGVRRVRKRPGRIGSHAVLRHAGRLSPVGKRLF